nr:carboxypeptidase regulatory-like domain-containing protein [Thermoflexales bacterium]
MNPLRTRLSLAGLGLMLAVLVLALSVGATSASINAVTLNGTATLPNGALPVPNNTWAWLLNPDKSMHGASLVVTGTGAFSFAGVAPGAYFVRVVPPAHMLNLAPSPIRPVFITATVGTLNLPPLALTTPSVTGTVYVPGGLAPTNATVKVFAGPLLVEDRPTVNGNFVIGGLPTGTYTLRAEPLPDDAFWPARPVSISLVPSAPHYVTLTLQAAQITGVVREGANVIEGARVHAITLGGERRSDVTGPLGRFALGDLPIGIQVVLKVEPPIDRGGLLPPAPMTVTTPISNVALFFGTSNKVVGGAVKTNTGLSVTHALIEAHRMDALGRARTETDANGLYVLRLSPGVWSIDVKPISTTLPHNWIDPNPPRLVQFDDTVRPEAKTLNFNVITADAHVIGAVELPDHSTPPFTVTVALHNDEGLGRAQDVDPLGHFAFDVPHGVYNLEVRVFDPRFAAPPLRPVYARPLTTTVVPTITLIPRNAFISGTLTNGANVPVIAWSPDTHATFGTRANDDGGYAIGVYSGTWLVRPAPLPDQPVIFNGDPATVTLAFNQVVPNVNFTLINADAVIHGTLVDDTHTPVTARGWASAVNADRSIRNGAPIDAGEFDVLVPSGTYTVSIDLPDGQRFMWNGERQLTTVASGETATVTFTLIEKTAIFKGSAWDKRADKSVAVDGRVWAAHSALDDGLHTATDLKAGGYFTLPVPAGLWHLNYAIDPEADYLKAAGARSYGLQAGQTQIMPLPVLKKDALLTGTVVLTDGVTPARGAIVIAEGLSPEVNGLTLRAPVNDDGRFALQLPFGLYNVRSVRVPDRGLINPVVKGVN